MAAAERPWLSRRADGRPHGGPQVRDALLPSAVWVNDGPALLATRMVVHGHGIAALPAERRVCHSTMHAAAFPFSTLVQSSSAP